MSPMRKPDEGHPAEGRRRAAHFEHFHSEILREATDFQTLTRVEARVLHHPTVLADAGLAAMLRASLSARRAEIQARQADAVAAELAPSTAAPPPTPRAPGVPAGLTADQVVHVFERLRHDLEERLTHFDLVSARDLLQKIGELRQRHTEIISETALEHCRADLERHERRADEFEEEIEQLADTAVQAAEHGRHAEAAQALRRLSGIHASRPLLLGDARFEVIREAITRAGRHHEHREAARALVARERAAVEELRRIGQAINEFHRAAKRSPKGSPEYAAAEEACRDALRMVRGGDREWLADLMLELDDLVEQVHDTSGRAAEQVEHFLASVRKTLADLRARIPQGE